MQALEIDQHRRLFLQLVQEADSIESLRWCQRELEKRMACLCAEKARGIREGDAVEVTEGPLLGNCGRVIAHCCRAADMLLVEMDGLALDLPLPIPAAALRVLVSVAAPS